MISPCLSYLEHSGSAIELVAFLVLREVLYVHPLLIHISLVVVALLLTSSYIQGMVLKGLLVDYTQTVIPSYRI